jgi:hypothetical protein
MLFDEILGNSNIINDSWKKEIDRWLVFIENKGELKRFIPRLTKMDSSKRDEALAEISSAYLLENELNFIVTGWEVPTRNNKNVDFVIERKVNEIFCEVKSPGWEGELSKKELMEGRKDQRKYIPSEWRSFGHWKNIRYAIKKAYPKFLSNYKNLVIIQDDLFVSILDFPTKTPIYIALYEETGQYNNEKGYFTNSDYENVGGILFIDINPTNSKKYKIKFFPNENSKIPFIIPTC